MSTRNTKAPALAAARAGRFPAVVWGERAKKNTCTEGAAVSMDRIWMHQAPQSSDVAGGLSVQKQLTKRGCAPGANSSAILASRIPFEVSTSPPILVRIDKNPNGFDH